ncbi:MAG: 30S ribosomal protein S4, partial [Phycisphaerae bacterium]|nr:30S ribosomal protein S4 [Phycisphaerae bacterium]
PQRANNAAFALQDPSMANYIGPKLKLSRRVGVPIADIPKHTQRQLTSPGMHGYRGRRLRDYGVRLLEKQKLRYHYNVLERQFRRYVDIAGRSKGNSGAVLLTILERRLDNVIRRLGYARTIWSARQIVAHGHVKVNGHKVDRPSFAVKVGDKIEIREKSQKMIRENLESLPGHEVPPWLTFAPADLAATVAAEPTPMDIPFDVNMNLIVEFYR